MVGKQVVVVSNLKPVKLRGIESQGMIVALNVSFRLVVKIIKSYFADSQHFFMPSVCQIKIFEAGSEVG